MLFPLFAVVPILILTRQIKPNSQPNMAAGGSRCCFLSASKTGPSAHYESKPSDKTRAQSWLVLFSFLSSRSRALTRRKLFYFLHRRLVYKSEKGFEGQSLNLNEFARRALCVPILFLYLAARARTAR